MILLAFLAQTGPVPDVRSNWELWVAALAILTTLASSGIMQLPPYFGPWAKRAVAALVSLVLSAGGLYYSAELSTANLARTWLLVFLGATSLYVLISKPIADAMQGRPQT